jgi:hypothetical protein
VIDDLVMIIDGLHQIVRDIDKRGWF